VLINNKAMLLNPKLKNRFPGGNAFSETDDNLFFGRQNDQEKLSNLIFIRQMVVLFGKSGYGKSSLINAGIVPMLKKQDEYVYLSVRFNTYVPNKEEAPVSPVETTIRRFSESMVMNDNAVRIHKKLEADNSFWYWIKQIQLGKPVRDEFKFIIFFDQFEELFTYPREQIAQFSDELSQLLYGRIPAGFRKRLENLDEIDVMTEEIYAFFHSKPDVKVVFSVRSDKLSLLNQLSERLPAILQNCYELGALYADDARLAITKPAKLVHEDFKTQTFLFDDEAVDKIISCIVNGPDGKIEAATLQMICRYIEENLVADQDKRHITADLLGDITTVFQQYYQSILDKLPEAERSDVQHFIEDHLINEEHRNALADEYIETQFGISKETLSVLEQSSLLRRERDQTGRYIYEISHDSIVAAINRVAAVRRAEEEEQEKLLLAERLARERATNEQLTILHQTARHRYRLSMIFGLLFFVSAVFAIYYLFKSKAEFNRYKIAKERSIQATFEKNRQQELARAAQIMNDGDNYRRLNTAEYRDTACLRYQEALLILRDYPKEYLYHEINNKIVATCLKK
jgi:hypothetical protein